MEARFDSSVMTAMQTNERMVHLLVSAGTPAESVDAPAHAAAAGTRFLEMACEPRQLVNIATGMGLYGLYPVAKISQAEFLAGAFLPLRSACANFRYKSGGQFTVPMTLVVECEGPLVAETLALQVPGLQVFAPASEAEYTNLIEALAHEPDPAVVFRPKAWREYADAVRAMWETPLPLHKARVLRAGDQITLVSFGAVTALALAAAEVLSGEGKSVEVVDLRALSPIDFATVLTSVKKTGRLILLQESPGSFGVASEMAARIGEEALDSLLAPIRRVTGFDIPMEDLSQAVGRPDLDSILFSVRNLNDF